MERTPVRVTSESGFRCAFCGEVFTLNAKGYSQVFVTKDGKELTGRSSKRVGDLVYRCTTCVASEKKETVNGDKLVEPKIKKYSAEESKRLLDKERGIADAHDFARSTFAGWKP